jgi:3-oxoacyl-[acyl-carrier protein] reductase
MRTESHAFRLDDQVAVVTGGSGRLGSAIVVALARAGANVWINHLGEHADASDVRSRVAALGGRAAVVEADVSEPDEVEHLVSAILGEAGRVDIWVNNAAINTQVPVTEMSVETWDQMVKVNLRSVFLCTRAILPSMLHHGAGSIINVGSQGALRGAPTQAHYAAAKGGVHAFTRSVAREVGSHGVRVNAIAPGPFLSPMTEPRATSQWIAGKLEQRVLPRLGEAEEIAETVVFLASPAATLYIGQTLSPNGGGVM